MSARRLSSEALWIVAGRGAAAVAAFASVKILTAMMSPALYGRYSLTLGIGTLVTSFLVTPVAQGLNRLFYDALNAGALRDFIKRGILITSTLALVGAVVAFPIFWFYADGAGDWWKVAALTTVAVLAGNIRDRQVGLFNMYRWRGRFVTLAATDAWLRIAAVTAAITLLGPSLVSATLGVGIGAVAIAALGVPWLRQLLRESRIGRTADAAFDVRLLYAFAKPLFVVTLLAWVLGTSDRYILGKMVPAAELGRYVAGYQIASAGFGVVMGIFFPIVLPVMLQNLSKSSGRPVALDRYVLLIAAASIIVGAIAVVDVHGISTIILSRREFESGDAVIPLVTLGTVFQAVQAVAEQEAHFRQNTRPLITVYALSAVANVVFNLLLVPHLGILGAALSTCLAFIIQLGATVVLCKPQISMATWMRTGVLLAVGSLLTIAVRAVIPAEMPTLPRAILRWCIFFAMYGVYAGWTIRHELVATRTVFRPPLP